MSKVFRAIPFVLILITMVYLSHIPGGPRVIRFQHADKVGHFGLFFLMTASIIYWFRAFSNAKRHKFFYAYTFLLVAVIGLLDEYHQSYVPNRDVSFLDWLADCLGGLCFLIISKMYLKRSNKSKSI
jgi:VanZ family protein